MNTITGDAEFRLPISGYNPSIPLKIMVGSEDYELGYTWNLKKTDLTNATRLKAWYEQGRIELSINRFQKDEKQIIFYGPATWIGSRIIYTDPHFRCEFKNPMVGDGPYMIQDEDPIPLERYLDRAKCFRYLFNVELELIELNFDVNRLVERAEDLTDQYLRHNKRLVECREKMEKWANEKCRYYRPLMEEIRNQRLDECIPDPSTLEILDQWLSKTKGLTLADLPDLL